MSLKIITFATKNITTFPEKELYTASRSCHCNDGERSPKNKTILIWLLAIHEALRSCLKSHNPCMSSTGDYF